MESLQPFWHEKIRDGVKEKKRFVLIRCEQPECLNSTVILCGFEASGLVIFAVYIFQILSNTYITNYAHHLLILDRVWVLAWVKDCQGQKPLEKVCGLSRGFSQVFVTCAEAFSRTCLQEGSCMKSIHQRCGLYCTCARSKYITFSHRLPPLNSYREIEKVSRGSECTGERGRVQGHHSHSNCWEVTRLQLFTWFTFPILIEVQWSASPHLPQRLPSCGWSLGFYLNKTEQKLHKVLLKDFTVCLYPVMLWCEVYATLTLDWTRAWVWIVCHPR